MADSDEALLDDFEVETGSEDGDIEREIVGDTPEEDRGRKPLDSEEADPTDKRSETARRVDLIPSGRIERATY